MAGKSSQRLIYGVIGLTLIALLDIAVLAQRQTDRSRQRFGRGTGEPSRKVQRSDYPIWEVDAEFSHDVFTFARIRYRSFHGGRGRWDNDFPDCDWNFSYRLKELTSFEVDPNGRVLELTDPDLFDYPFIYMSNVAGLAMNDLEIAAMRRYLLNGGFLMADDFWTNRQWELVYAQMKKVFPEREPRELSWDHEIFHLVYNIRVKPQVPSIFAWQRGDTFEYWHGDPGGDEDPHFWAFFDDSERIVALLCQNNDIGDGWEREGENREYFERYSLKVSYPLGINIVTYAMTH